MQVPYRPSASNTAADMMSRCLDSSGTRALGRLPVRRTDPRTLSGVTQGFPTLHGYIPVATAAVPYQAAKRMRLGALGLTSTQAIGGARTGVAAAGTATAVGTSLASTIGLSAAAGSVVPVIGTAIGVIVGLLASGIFNRTDQEVGNFDQAVAIWQQNRNNVINIANKYLVLAGLFDLSLNNPHIPIYLQYGRMGEVNFVRDMVNRIYQAATTGQISASDTPQSIMDRIVQPWIDSFGKGPMVDPHADLINLIIVGMIAEYVAGQQTRWLARGGDYPFAGLPPFPLQQIIAASQPPAVVGPAPVPALPPPAPVVAPAPIFAPPPPPQAPVVAPAPALPVPVVVAAPPPPLPPQVAPGTTFTATPALPPMQTLPAPAVMTPAQPTFPSGFTLVGQDTNGNAVYANAQGVLYQWVGSSMVAFTGSLGGGNTNVASQIQAAIQTALAQGQSQAQATQTAMSAAQSAGVQVTPQLQQQVADQTAMTAAAPPQVTAAGGGSMLSGSSGLMLIAGVLGVLFLTARPAKNG